MKKVEHMQKRLLRYFLMSTIIPFFCIVIIGSFIMVEYYKTDVLTIAQSYAKSLSREASLYINQLKQIAILPNFSINTVNKIKELGVKDKISYIDQDVFDSLMGDLISSIRYTGNDFHSAMIVSDHNTIYYSSNYSLDSPPLNYDWSEESWYRDAIDNNGKFLFVPPHFPDYISYSDKENVASIITTIRNYITTEPYAVMKIDFMPDMMKSYLELDNFHVPCAVYIVDDKNNLIFYESLTERMAIWEEKIENNSFDANKDGVFLISNKIDGTPYTLNVLLDQNAMHKNSLRFYMISFGLYMIALVTAILLNKRLSNRISGPVESMKELLVKVEHGDFSARYTHQKQWELESLGNSLNEMIEQLEILIDRTYKAQLAQKEAENKALLNQIQPHFIFNTLNTMIGLLYEEKYEKLEENIFCLSDMLHTILRKDLYCTLSEEVSFIKDYLILQSSRFDGKIAYDIDVDKTLENIKLPRLLLQPFIENSIVHGMEPSVGKVFIKVCVKKLRNSVNIVINDNGIGFDPKQIDIMSSIGIRNCYERIHLLYEDSNISIDSSPGEGCTVNISFKVGKNNAITDC